MIAATLGWLGTAGTFFAYLTVSHGWLQPHSRRYATLNIVGGILGGTAGVLYGAWPSVASNFVWAFVGLVTVNAALRARRHARLDPVRTSRPAVRGVLARLMAHLLQYEPMRDSAVRAGAGAGHGDPRHAATQVT